MIRHSSLAFATVLLACDGLIVSGRPGEVPVVPELVAGGAVPSERSGGGEGGGAALPLSGGRALAPLTTREVFQRLKPTCAGCHSMDQRPFFADQQAFENLIVYNTRWIQPRSPQNSPFVELLLGRGPAQMPPAPGATLDELTRQGTGSITVDEIREWIARLTPRMMEDPLDVPQVRRKTAEQIRIALYQQLGLSESDFLNPNIDPVSGMAYDSTPRQSDSYAVRSSDAIVPQSPVSHAGILYKALGGAYYLKGDLPENQVTSTSLLALVPISQAWCRTAFLKPHNAAVLSVATLADNSTTAAGRAAIRSNLNELYLRMLGQMASSAELDDLYQHVFVPYERHGTTVAWTAVCSALVRDPLWILY